MCIDLKQSGTCPEQCSKCGDQYSDAYKVQDTKHDPSATWHSHLAHSWCVLSCCHMSGEMCARTFFCCIQCHPGLFVNTSGTTACDECDVDTFCSVSGCEKCTPCGQDMTTETRGSLSSYRFGTFPPEKYAYVPPEDTSAAAPPTGPIDSSCHNSNNIRGDGCSRENTVECGWVFLNDMPCVSGCPDVDSTSPPNACVFNAAPYNEQMSQGRYGPFSGGVETENRIIVFVPGEIQTIHSLDTLNHVLSVSEKNVDSQPVIMYSAGVLVGDSIFCEPKVVSFIGVLHLLQVPWVVLPWNDDAVANWGNDGSESIVQLCGWTTWCILFHIAPIMCVYLTFQTHSHNLQS